MRSVQVARPKGPFELVERDIPAPRAGTVRIKVQACGICHSDAFTKEGTFPGSSIPRSRARNRRRHRPLGAGVAGWTEGRASGVGWHADIAATATRAAAAISSSRPSAARALPLSPWRG